MCILSAFNLTLTFKVCVIKSQNSKDIIWNECVTMWLDNAVKINHIFIDFESVSTWQMTLYLFKKIKPNNLTSAYISGILCQK